MEYVSLGVTQPWKEWPDSFGLYYGVREQYTSVCVMLYIEETGL